MVHKRKNGTLNRDAFATYAKVERVEQVNHVDVANNAIVKQHKSQSFLFGLMVGFVLNTVLAILLVSTQAEIDYKNSQAGVDAAVSARITALTARLTDMEEFSHVPEPGEQAKELNENN